MKKFTFLLTHSEYEDFLTQIRELGVVHVKEMQQGATNEALAHALQQIDRYQAALRHLEAAQKTYEALNPQATMLEPMNAHALLQRVEDLQEQENLLIHQMDSTQKCVQQLEPWGDFSWQDVTRIEDNTQLKVFFFRCSTKFFREEWKEQYHAIPINEWEKSIYFIAFHTECPVINAEQIYLPEESLSHYQGLIKEQGKALFAIRQEYVSIQAQQRSVLEDGLTDARNEASLSRVQLCHEEVAGDTLRLMIGWVKASATQPLIEYLEGANIYYEMEDPAYEDEVPIQITNNAYSRLFEPILKMYSLPNYNDLDPTTFFAPFFMLFFGLCMGDAGYGVLIFLIGIFVALKGNKEMRSFGRLGAWLGAMTILCGLATGTVFGIDLSSIDSALVQPLKPYFLNDNGVGPIFGYSPMMVISVIIGLVQVLLGMVLKGCKAVKNYGWPYAVGTFSWVVAILAAICLYGLPQCGVNLPSICQTLLMALIGISALGIFFYNSPSSYKNPTLGLLSNVGGGLWATYGMATGLLGDLLSYIRLFALGLTGGVLGGVFNSLALDMTASMPLVARIPVMILILLAGHGITFALSMISAFVHPMRLTFVEFFKNADFSGGGKAYEPFRDLRKQS